MDKLHMDKLDAPCEGDARAKSRAPAKSGFDAVPVTLPDALLMSVEKPGRYTGGEWNAHLKKGAWDPGSRAARFAFCFPDTYEVGMSHLGMRILCHVVGSRADACCERAFAPWTDMEARMRQSGVPLYALESRMPLSAFDMLGFTLQYELSYTNVLNMLDLGGVPVLAGERGDYGPVVLAGGPCACNPAPLEEFIDLFFPGEGEFVLDEAVALYAAMKADAPGGRVRRQDYIERAAMIEGVYAPSAPPPPGRRVRKRVAKDLGAAPFPADPAVPYVEAVHDRAMLELFRGCSRGCRFCQAGFLYRPVRERTPETLARQARDLLDSTGYDEIALTSLSTSDYSRLPELADELLALCEPRKVNLSLPSLRVDNFSLGLASSASAVRKSGLTFAPEAGTQRLRDAINKGVAEDDVFRSVAMAAESGYASVKLYFMIGLPTETEQDLCGIADMAKGVSRILRDAAKAKGARPGQTTASVSTFVPKPFTPFQWEAQDAIDVIEEKQRFIAARIKARGVTYRWHDARTSFLEAAFARGGREMGRVLHEAWKLGCVFDGWGDKFRYGLWEEAFARAGVDPKESACRARGRDETLPWDVMDYGVDKAFLWRERELAYAGKTTLNCKEGCAGCGIWEITGCGLRDRHVQEAKA